MTRTQIKLTIPSTPSTKGKTRGSKKTQAMTSASSRVAIPERGIVLTSEKHGELEEWLRNAIADLSWEVFVEPLEPACVEFVTQFLSAYDTAKLPKVLIDGVEVSFSEEDINDLFNLPLVPLEEDAFEQYSKNRSNKETTDEVLQSICNEGAMWEKGESVMRKNLRFEAKVWMHFINSRLIPGSHDTRVTWERAVLVFCILNQKKFDVGRIIRRQLSLNVGRKSPFYFPCLVTEMCKSVGLQPKSQEVTEVTPTGAFIDQGTIKRLRENEGLDEEEVGDEKEEDEEEEKEEKTETNEMMSESIKQEEQEVPKKKPPPKWKKTTAGRRKTPEEGATSAMGGLSLWARGADVVAQQIGNIKKMVGEELQLVMQASIAVSQEKDKLEQELRELKKRKTDPVKEPEQQDTIKALTEIITALRGDLLKKEQEHNEERASWIAEQEKMRTMLLQMFKYVRDRDAVADSNWAGKFKGQPRFPQFPDILPPEAITGAPEGASSHGEQ